MDQITPTPYSSPSTIFSFISNTARQENNSLPNILLGLSGSVASVKAPLLYNSLSKLGNVIVVETKNASFFSQSEQKFPQNTILCNDSVEWDSWTYFQKSQNTRFGKVLHIELRKWADILVIAPCSANLLSAASTGRASNLLESLIRCWDLRSRTTDGQLLKPFLLAPAMNTLMWDHPATEIAINTLKKWGVTLVPPVSKTLACGDIGTGAMASVDEIYLQTYSKISLISHSSKT